MMSSSIMCLWLGALHVAEVNAEQGAIDAIVESSRISVPAKRIEKTAPYYPMSELNKGSQGWVRIAYCIDESGSTQNVSVLDSLGSRRFEIAAVEAVKQWQFEPALIDGKPSWQSRNQVFVNFAVEGGNAGASRRFATRFREIGKLIDNGDLEEADKLFQRVYETYDLSLYELSKLWAQRVRYEVLSGDMYKLDLALHRAGASKGSWIDKDSYIGVLNMRVQVELIIGQYNSAFGAFGELIDTAGEDAEEVLMLRPTMEGVRDVINGGTVIEINAKVRTRDECYICNNSWTFIPIRNDFRLANITGTLETIEMLCDHKRFESAVSDRVEWHIPDDWGTCFVNIYGDLGTTFDVLMLPAS